MTKEPFMKEKREMVLDDGDSGSGRPASYAERELGRFLSTVHQVCGRHTIRPAADLWLKTLDALKLSAVSPELHFQNVSLETILKMARTGWVPSDHKAIKD